MADEKTPSTAAGAPPLPTPPAPTMVTAEEKANAKKSAEVSGAQSVADAVKRVADAAVAAAQKSEPETTSYDFRFTGTPGGTFAIDGNNLGSSGTVLMGKTQLFTTEWSTTHIEGTLPAGMPSGEVVVHIDDKTNRRGYFKA